MKRVRLLLALLIAVLFHSCQPTHRKLEPVFVYSPPAYRIQELPSAFPSLSPEESAQEWSKELLLGNAFARDLDLYRAITCYKRARILLPEELVERQLQIDYNIILSYYLGHKYQEAINTFEASLLTNINPLFPAFNNLVILLYDSYVQLGQEDKAACLFEAIEKCSPDTARDLSLYFHLKQGCIEEAQAEISVHPCPEEFQPSLDNYYLCAKSPYKARVLNAVLPGAGYHYVGQTKSAITSFLINALFTAAAYQFFHKGYFAAGMITASLEAGWYFGGINGAGIEAEEYNARLYECNVKEMLIRNNFFPVLMLETAF